MKKNNSLSETGQYPYLEKHRYSPEQNTLHISPKEEIKVGFFDFNYNPTLQEAIDFAKRMGLLVDKKDFTTSKAAFEYILREPESFKRGAPMGRDNVGKFKPINKKVYDRQVNLINGYDKGGHYWGFPSNLRVEYSLDCTYINFYRK